MLPATIISRPTIEKLINLSAYTIYNYQYALIHWFFIGYWINTGFDFYHGPFFLPISLVLPYILFLKMNVAIY